MNAERQSARQDHARRKDRVPVSVSFPPYLPDSAGRNCCGYLAADAAASCGIGCAQAMRAKRRLLEPFVTPAMRRPQLIVEGQMMQRRVLVRSSAAQARRLKFRPPDLGEVKMTRV